MYAAEECCGCYMGFHDLDRPYVPTLYWERRSSYRGREEKPVKISEMGETRERSSPPGDDRNNLEENIQGKKGSGGRERAPRESTYVCGRGVLRVLYGVPRSG